MRIHARTSEIRRATCVAAGGRCDVTGARGTESRGQRGTVMFGASISETNAATPGSKNTAGRDTLNAWVKTVNAAGGVNGNKVAVKTVDDGNDPAKASSVVKSLIDDGVVAIVGRTANRPIRSWRADRRRRRRARHRGRVLLGER